MCQRRCSHCFTNIVLHKWHVFMGSCHDDNIWLIGLKTLSKAAIVIEHISTEINFVPKEILILLHAYVRFHKYLITSCLGFIVATCLASLPRTTATSN